MFSKINMIEHYNRKISLKSGFGIALIVKVIKSEFMGSNLIVDEEYINQESFTPQLLLLSFLWDQIKLLFDHNNYNFEDKANQI